MFFPYGGLIIIVSYAGGVVIPAEELFLITESGIDILTEDSHEIIVTT